MNLKPFVNDKLLYDDFLRELDSRIRQTQSKLEKSTLIEDVYRAQGAIDALRRLKQLREQVNG